MKSISIWAGKNRWKTISILIPLHLILSIFYLYAGVYLFANGITFSEQVVYWGHGLFLMAWICYPLRQKTKGFYKSTYIKKKFWQGVVMLATMVYLTNIGNQLARSSMMTMASESYLTQPVVLGSKKAKKSYKKQSRKERRLSRKRMKKELRAFVKNMRKKGQRKRGGGVVAGQVFLVFLTIAVAVGLAYLILALSCHIACAGNEALALVVLLGGAVLLIWGIVASIKGIMRMGEPKAKSKTAPD